MFEILYQLNRRPEKGPVRVHLLELFELAAANLLLQSLYIYVYIHII